MLLVGLTGGIGSGKSTVADTLRDLGVPVIDADRVARQVVQPGTPALAQIERAFAPSHVLDADGALDRSAMRARIVADPSARSLLESITHPAIRAAISAACRAYEERGEKAVVVEAALLVETGGYRLYPVLVVVSCSPETQLARVVARDGMEVEQARALIATQLSLREKEAVATHVLSNDGTLEALRAATTTLWGHIEAVHLASAGR